MRLVKSIDGLRRNELFRALLYLLIAIAFLWQIVQRAPIMYIGFFNPFK